MSILTIVLSGVYLFLIKKFSRCMIYFTMAVSFVMFAVLVVALFLAGLWMAGIIMLALFFCCI